MVNQNAISSLKTALQARIIGQAQLIESLVISLLADGHLLVEGAPGLAKTTAIKTLADGLQCSFKRIQFTPDLMPADVTGSDIYRTEEHRFEFQPGPVFANLVLADEINRAPAKVQSALLEAMSERQVSASGTTYSLPDPFLVMATQNPVEHEGTYPLPEAQLDRFLMKVSLDYPSIEEERSILHLARQQQSKSLPDLVPVAMDDVLAARKEVEAIHVSDAVESYIVRLVDATRRPENYSDALANLISYGASPRATIALDLCARVVAWLENKDFVTPAHVQWVAGRVLAHRLVLSLPAQAKGYTGDSIVEEIISAVAVG
ncbi:AAA family ATPase [Reinekea marinisedimentorum]|uniref:MoxR-like ATPase n=1 Tax=Reinekea marinisedimentorum TaxID=230495 RepID=A0A4R3I4V2_9GAMM|nr:AAA family ATPase [Reinekea marinisedimentorum]TCS40651.1 MoxR-like ATPase [Reinekea marinisedimentorum]